MTRYTLVLCAAALFWSGATAWTQEITRSLLDGTTPPGIASGAQAGSFSLSGLESINLFSGRLNFSIPLLRVEGRGEAAYTITLPIETHWEVTARLSATVNFMYLTLLPSRSTRVGYAPGFLESRFEQDERMCGAYVYTASTLRRLSWTEADGGEHELIDTKTHGTPQTTGVACVEPQSPGAPTYYDRGREFVSTDGSSMTFIADAPIPSSPAIGVTDDPTVDGLTGWLHLKNGTRYRVESGSVRQIIDRNGNRIRLEVCTDAAHDGSTTNPCTAQSADRDPFSRPVRIIDSLGRTIKIEYGTGTTSSHPNEDRIIYPGGDPANPRTIYVRYALLSTLQFDNGTLPKTRDLFPSADYGAGAPNDSVFDLSLPGEIQLPNGTTYTFRYNKFGELVRATLPTGGQFEYDWAPMTSTAPNDGIFNANSFTGPMMVYRRVTERRVFSAPGAVASVTSYEAPLLSSQGGSPAITAIEKAADASQTALRKTVSSFMGSPAPTPVLYFAYGSWNQGKLSQEERQTASGVMVQRLTHTWMNRDPSTNLSFTPTDPSTRANDPRITQTVRTLGSAVATTTFTYSADVYNNITEKCEFGFAQTNRCRQWDYVTAGAYTAPPAHLRGLVLSERVGSGSGAAFIKLAETQYSFDGSGLTDRTGISEHDPGWSASYALRGNPTTVARWENTPGSSEVPAGDPWIRTQYHYDIAGNVTQIDHPAVDTGNGVLAAPVTTVAYDDSYAGPQPPNPTFAFPTTIHHPGGLDTAAQFHYNLGKILSFTDPNGRVTSYQYGGLNANGTAAADPYTGAADGADPLDRLTRVIHPIGQTVFVYTPVTRQITTKKQLTSTSVVTADSYADGLGRPKQSVTHEGGSDIVVDTDYDALGRVASVSNPYRGSPNGYTTTSYDELDRPLDITHPDLAVTRMAYTNNETLVRDPANVWRKTVDDGLGRLASVYEDAIGSITRGSTAYSNSSGANYLTSYTYDALDDLTNVAQAGRDRAFTYDSLRRLLMASAPELGPSLAEGDAADSNGTITYSYDPAGNLITRTEPRTASAGLTRTSAYDVLGRVTRKSYSDATPTVTYCYDGASDGACAGAPTDPSAGHEKNLKGKLTRVSNGVSTMAYQAYDELGRVTSSSQTFGADASNYPFSYGYNFLALKSVTYPSSRQVTYGFDAAGRINTVAAGTTSYVSAVAYAPHGPIQQITYGLGRYEQTCYNNRLQVQAILLRTAAPAGPCTDTTNNLWTLGLGYGPSNNGNPTSETLSDGGSWNATQTFTYDQLNRLRSAEEAAAAGAGWKRSFAYDQWGNQWVDEAQSSGLSVDTVTPNGSFWITAKNRLKLSAGSYDRAGNQLQIAGHAAAYDGEGRLTSLNGVSYGYDGEGRRVTKAFGTTATQFVYDAFGRLAAEYGPGAGSGMSCTTCYLTADHLGSTRVVWDGTGVRARYDYLPFGETIPADRNGRSGVSCGAGVTGCYGGETALRHRFTGKERDSDTANSAMATGLDYFGARYYGGALGRWTSPDLINLTKARLLNPSNTLNKYVYGANNPLKYVDPDGQDITVFYRRGNMANPGDSGHAFVAVLNQNTGQTAFMSFAPKSGAVPFGAGAYNTHLSPDYLRQHASLTIQTTPELAQKAINEINRRLQNPGSYNLFTNNCATQCESLLRLLDIATTDGFHPDDLWTQLYRNYSAQAVDHGEYGVPSVQYQPGKEFGQPRFAGPGFDYQKFLWQLYVNQIQTQPKQPKACVTVQGPNGPETECH